MSSLPKVCATSGCTRQAEVCGLDHDDAEVSLCEVCYAQVWLRYDESILLRDQNNLLSLQ